MNLDSLLTNLESTATMNDALTLLSQIVVDTDHALIRKLKQIISSPETIDNTNHFASIIDFFSHDDFIPPLIKTISKAELNTSPWLSDYMYALGSILMDRDDLWEPDEDFIHLLGNWLHSTGGGEISWKAAVILAHLKHSATRKYFLSGSVDNSLFHQTRIACINGIMNHYPEDAPVLLKKLENDPEKEVREEVARAIEWLKD